MIGSFGGPGGRFHFEGWSFLKKIKIRGKRQRKQREIDMFRRVLFMFLSVFCILIEELNHYSIIKLLTLSYLFVFPLDIFIKGNY